MKEYSGLEIAIIGMAGKFPGAADVHAFWDNLANGVESISFFTDEELAKEGVDRSLIDNPRYVKANGLLENKDCFDSSFFNYRPDEARLMEPQMRIFHECVWAALEDAGYNPDDEKNKVGLFAGSTTNINWEVYAHLMNRKGYVDNFSVSLLANPRFIPTRISYNLNLKGPSVYLDTACSTSLVAVHQATKSLLLGECNIAVAGGVHITGRSRTGYMYEEGMIHSRDGHCRTFDNTASGTVSSEGAGVVVLKTLKNALKDGDHIWAIVKGSGVNNDGSDKVGYTAPSIHGQLEAILMAQKWAKTVPESISYIEAHGTATKLGDPVEVEALAHVFGNSTEKYCALGSVKSNIGHLDAAAGVAGLIKTVLALKHRQIPPSLHFQTPNQQINFAGTPFYVNTTLKEWQNDQYPLRAGVSSFGIGGTNAHIILEEAPQLPDAAESRPYQLLLFSAKTPAALERMTEKFRQHLETDKSGAFADIAYTLQTGRKHFPYRKYIVCSSPTEAIQGLAMGKSVTNVEPVADKLSYRKVFMFPGQGSQYVNMCYDLYASEPAFKEEADRCFAIIKQLSGKDLLPVAFNEGGVDAPAIDNTEHTQPLLFVMEYALARSLIKWDIVPDMMIGHSIGEYVAACLSGVFSLEDALWLVIRRGELVQKAPVGAMLSISVSPDALRPLLARYGDVSLAAVNSSSLCVVSGNKEAIQQFRAAVDQEGYENRLLRTSHAFHSCMMDGILDQFRDVVNKIPMHPQQIPFI
ncbi:MAG TPA: type I polyketide synthase [Puia sp.]|nr:type I polyketide synthase [Puia sp.]